MNIFDHKDKDACKKGLCLDKHQSSRLVALLLLIACFVFVAGYFWGQKTAIDQLLNSVERDSFADQIQYSMCSMYDQKDDESSEPDAVSGDEETEQGDAQIASQQERQESASEITPSTYAAAAAKPAQKDGHKKWCAQLAGFGAEKQARNLIVRLERKGINVELRTRHSRTARGKMIPWYQVVTRQYDSRQALDEVVTKISKYEKIRGIQIVELS
jgi:septal ring-binding cell division protein DamX